MTGAGIAVLTVLVALLLGTGFLLGRRTARPLRPSDVGTPVEHATFETLHTASLAAPPLRAGLTEESARRSARRLRSLLGTDALCLTDRERVLVWDGAGHHHGKDVLDHVGELLEGGRGTAFDSGCADLDCPLRWAVAVPLTVENRVLGALVAYAPRESAVLARAAGEVARWVCVQLELAELDRSRTQLIEAEIKALRAQISPHFIFNSLAAIASFVRTDPEQARELLLEFADFTRYSFRRHGEFTTLADELHSIDQYLALVRARFGKRLSVTLQVAPEVLPVALPFLCLQPLVENAVKHGLEGAVTPAREHSADTPFRITISALDAGSEAEVVIEDNGGGMDPERLRRVLRGEATTPSTGIGLLNVDERLRQVYGDGYGLVIETGVGAGMKITLRLPKYRAGVHGS
ncbi:MULTISPECIES: histidine kinase [Streptomyces]|uniref:Sensor histidine kinase n=1 Tax=Streptomyces rhizosphaericola TaxID=2564098 RepID=A0ABY2P7V0_9ACTN|nr:MULTISPECIES: histidine kinase [Streptomyces]ARI51051.1 histidine kinase [Streptomyces sp. S8]MYT95047.1 sensor histidine kinase [Streptomyces sp. SID8359]MYU01083.1 sensor histidine kinase [Streptomyces sp. SID8350]NGO87515.1 sensor histidine kinase [Streptomyces sp. 196(2019)]PWS41434.1 sensor histidine kinase [Streptomyces sp. ZEA17I]